MTWRLITPPDNYRGATEIPEAALPVLERLARIYGGCYKEDPVTSKLYFHPTKPANAPRPIVQTGTRDLILPVTHYSQLDSQVYGGEHALRMCQSSSCAMLLKWLKPGALSARPNADDEYLQRVFKYGDTTDSAAQLEALRTLLDGKAEVVYRQNLSFADLDAQLKLGLPIPVGILHHGHVSHPTGGGHWIVVVGRKADGSAYYVNDPAGELDLVNGRYVGTDGDHLLYSAENLGRRWMCDAAGNYTPGRGGWGFIARKLPGAA